jgi:hypothetical protein
MKYDVIDKMRELIIHTGGVIAMRYKDQMNVEPQWTTTKNSD